MVALHPTKSGNSRFCLKAELTAGAGHLGQEICLVKRDLGSLLVPWQCPWEQWHWHLSLCSWHCRRLFWDVGQCSYTAACFCPVSLQSLVSLKLRPHSGCQLGHGATSGLQTSPPFVFTGRLVPVFPCGNQSDTGGRQPLVQILALVLARMLNKRFFSLGKR